MAEPFHQESAAYQWQAEENTDRMFLHHTAEEPKLSLLGGATVKWEE